MYLIKRMSSQFSFCPCELLFKAVPKYHTLKTFGCACYPWLQPYSSNKLDAKSKLCVFLGYILNHSSYICLNTVTNKLYISRHLVFDDASFPFKQINFSHTTSPIPLITNSSFHISFTIPLPFASHYLLQLPMKSLILLLVIPFWYQLLHPQKKLNKFLFQLIIIQWLQGLRLEYTNIKCSLQLNIIFPPLLIFHCYSSYTNQLSLSFQELKFVGSNEG